MSALAYGNKASIAELAERALGGNYYLTPEEACRLGHYVAELEVAIEHYTDGRFPFARAAQDADTKASRKHPPLQRNTKLRRG